VLGFGACDEGQGVLGLAIEDRLRVCALESPVAMSDLGLKLTRCPAGVADEDPQTAPWACRGRAGGAAASGPRSSRRRHKLGSHAPVAWERKTGSTGTRMKLVVEVHFVAHLREVLKIREELRARNWHRPVDDNTDRGGPEILHHEHNRVRESAVRLAQ
jgi:hypothetical protein